MKKVLLKICVAFALAATASAQVGPCDDLPGGTGFVNDYSSCEAYFSCVGGNAFPVNCPDGLHFDADLLVCAPPDSVNCVPGGCPATGIITVAVPGSCSAYILCINGEPFDRTCGTGLFFNPIIGSCDFPDNTDCQLPSCPQTPGLSFAADPQSCSHYFVCLDGEEAGRRQCAPGLFFDTWALMCTLTATCPLRHNVWRVPEAPIVRARIVAAAFFEDGEMPTVPNNIPTVAPNIPTVPTVGTGPGVETTKLSTPVTPPPAPPVQTTATTTANPAFIRTTTPTPTANVWTDWPTGPVRCPAAGIHYIGHHLICTVFQVCSHGSLFQVNCPAGQHWSTRHGACEWPDRSDCPW